jgi:hypothetical protein
MISAELEFENGSLDGVLTAFLSLPPSLRPTHFSDDELDVSRRKAIDDSRDFALFFDKRTTGFFLSGPVLNCLVSIAPGQSIRVHCTVEGTSNLAKQFLVHMARVQPIFGFACAPEERAWRNRVTTKQGVNSIESWVGRDTQKYVPGLYWLTLLPVALAEKHKVPLSAVEGMALEHVELEGGQHLFRFYERPEDWRSAAGSARLRSSLTGVFDVEKVRPQLTAATNFLDLNGVLRNWK